jgi:hypothetical protein
VGYFPHSRINGGGWMVGKIKRGDYGMAKKLVLPKDGNSVKVYEQSRQMAMAYTSDQRRDSMPQ